MERFYKKVDHNPHLPNVSSQTSSEADLHKTQANHVLPKPSITYDDSGFPILPSDPGNRPPITAYHPNIREQVRRKYYSEGPCQPKLNDFPQRLIYGIKRRFNHEWFNDFGWLEYSIEEDSAYCLYCYLFKCDIGQQGGGKTFVTEGFTDWSKKVKLHKHEGGPGSVHDQCFNKCKDLLNQKQHLETVVAKMTGEAKKNYKAQLTAVIDCIKWLLRQWLAFRGHDESEESSNQGNFLELLKFLADHSEDVRNVVFKNAPGNLQLTSSRIQKEIVRACAFEISKATIEELGGDFFSVLLDDSRDVSTKEQMAVVLIFVDNKGRVLERTLGFKHVECTNAKSLQVAL